MSEFQQIILGLLRGLGNTSILFFTTLVFALPLGLIISFGSMSKLKPLKFLTKIFVWIIRGTPLMLQILLVSFLPKYLFGSTTKAWAQALGLSVSNMLFVFVIIAFVINYACYFSEIYRGGIESISTGQHEAYQVLGMTRSQGFFRVILLQVIKRIVPPMSNEIITLVKDTSIARIIGFYEIIFFAQKYIKNAGLIWPLLYTGVFYLIFSGVLSILFSKLEKKLNYFKS